jgi:hypothetical protein
MKNLITFSSLSKTSTAVIAITLLLGACSGGASSSGSSGAVTGVATPSKVSVVNTN